ncbi:MAG: tyrosine-type recombinase/integrase, partial [Isosphaeraceae bacterium]
EHAKRYYRRDGRPTGEHVVIRAAHRPLLDLYGSVPVAEFTPKHLKLVRSEMIRLDWSRRHINAQVRRIKRMFFWAVEEGLVSGAVCYSLQEVKALRKHRSDAREKPEVGPVADEHVKAVVPYVSEVVADVIRVMRLSGMRPGEACAMMVEQIDRTDPECWRYVPGAHKTQHRGKPRVIFLGPKCQQILTRRILKAGTGRVFPISRSSVRTAIIRGCRRASVPNWSPNQLRHAAATEIRAKYGIEGAQVILGHSQVTTSQIYAEVNVERGREIAKLVG